MIVAGGDTNHRFESDDGWRQSPRIQKQEKYFDCLFKRHNFSPLFCVFNPSNFPGRILENLIRSAQKNRPDPIN